MKKAAWLQRHLCLVATCVLLLLLLAKFFYPLVAYDVPLGYDPGMYRYLFVKYAQAFPGLPELRPWAQEYPYGLFLFSSILIKMGVPISWLMGWMWSVMAFVLLGTLAWIFAKREGAPTGVLILLLGSLSIAYYDGFAQMYWKTYLALFFLILAFDALERNSLWVIPFGILTILTHNQTGLILGLVFLLWWFIELPTKWRDPVFRKWTVVFAIVVVAGVALYAPIWFRAFWAPFKSLFLLRGARAPPGSFPSPLYYLSNGYVLFTLGIGGCIQSFRKEKFSVWQLGVLVCAIFIAFRLVFYHRFFLQLDFFLLPFAAIAVTCIWQERFRKFFRPLLIIALIAQGFLAYPLIRARHPLFTFDELHEIGELPDFVEDNAKIIALENNAAVWLLGWLPDYYTGGPGLFDFPAWTYEQWEKFLYGSRGERLQLLMELPERPLYFMTSQLFFTHYGDHVKPFLADPCFEEVEGAPLLRVVCDPE